MGQTRSLGVTEGRPSWRLIDPPPTPHFPAAAGAGKGSWGSSAWSAQPGLTQGGSGTPPRGPPTSVSGSAPSGPTASRGRPESAHPGAGSGDSPVAPCRGARCLPAGRRGRRGPAPHLSAPPGGPGAAAAGPSARGPVSAVALIPGAPPDKSPGRLRASARGGAQPSRRPSGRARGERRRGAGAAGPPR